MDARIHTKLGKKVADAREIRNVSYTDIAFQTGVQKSVVQAIEQGKEVDTKLLVSVLKFLKMDSDIAVIYNPIFNQKK
jgi:hypothetical protein